MATKVLDSNPVGSVMNTSGIRMVFVRDKSGVHVPRLGARNPSKNLTMLETGEVIYSPMTQVCCPQLHIPFIFGFRYPNFFPIIK